MDPSEDPAAYAQRLKEQGNEAFRDKQYGTALTYYSCALEVDPQNATLYLNRAICHGGLSQWVHSKIDAQQAIDLSPEYYPKAHCRYILALVTSSMYLLTLNYLFVLTYKPCCD